MRDYGKVHSRFWKNPDTKTLDPDAKLVALYLLTSPHANLIGCYHLPLAYASEDLQMPIERLSKAFETLSERAFVVRDNASGWVWIRRFLAFNPFENPNVAKAALKVLDTIPPGLPFFADFIGLIGELGAWDGTIGAAKLEAFRKPFETLSNSVRKPEPEPIPEPEPKKVSSASGSPPDDGLFPDPNEQDQVADAVAAYNDVARTLGLQIAKAINQQRRVSMRRRLAACGGLEGWRHVLGLIKDRPFLLGQNDRGWKADLDFLLQETSFIRLSEGGYAGKANGRGSGGVTPLGVGG